MIGSLYVSKFGIIYYNKIKIGNYKDTMRRLNDKAIKSGNLFKIPQGNISHSNPRLRKTGDNNSHRQGK